MVLKYWFIFLLWSLCYTKKHIYTQISLIISMGNTSAINYIYIYITYNTSVHIISYIIISFEGTVWFSTYKTSWTSEAACTRKQQAWMYPTKYGKMFSAYIGILRIHNGVMDARRNKIVVAFPKLLNDGQM